MAADEKKIYMSISLLIFIISLVQYRCIYLRLNQTKLICAQAIDASHKKL